MRCGLVCALALLTFFPAATGAAPLASIESAPAAGPAPLRVTFTAAGGSASYHWDFGDGTAADGQTVEHTYTAGRWTAALTSRSADGTTATESTTVTAFGLTLTGPNPARYDRKVVLRGAIVPAERNLAVQLAGPHGKTIASARTRADGSYVFRIRIRAPGSYTATSEQASAAPLALRVTPKLTTGFAGSSARGSAYYFTARLAPSGAGTLDLEIARGQDVILHRTFGSRVRIKLDTGRLTTYRITTQILPSEGFTGAVRLLRTSIVLPRLTLGARSAAVAQLGDQLRRLHYAAPGGLSFDSRMLDAVYAFQKVHGIPRTGTVDARFWHALASPRHPRPKFTTPAAHIEVNKGLQVLYVVRSSQIALIAPISTAGVAGTFTPVGRFAVYRKVSGFDPSPLGTLYDPLYFTGGYAIHGNPSVPPYPASHGCVRVPMWVAPELYRTIPYGETVYVY